MEEIGRVAVSISLLEVILGNDGLCLGDFGVQLVEAHSHQDGDTDRDVEKDVLSQDVGGQAQERRVSDLEIVLPHKPQDVDAHAETQEVVHLEQKAQGALLALEVHGVEFEELINPMEAEVDEQQPVDESVVSNVCRIRVLIPVRVESSFEHQRVGGEAEADQN